MDDRLQAIMDAAQLVLREAEDQLLDVRRGSLPSSCPGSITSDGGAASHSRLEQLQMARQKLGSAIERIFLHSGLEARGGTQCRLAVERLNEDVLREIFLCVNSSYDHHAPSGVPAFPMAFGLACVSRRWRAVAIASASIWTKVRIRFHGTIYETLHERLSAIVERSGACELDLVVLSTPGMNSRDLTRTVMDALARVFARSRAIQMSWHNNVVRFNGSLLPLLLSDMPHLRSFRMVQHPDEAAAFEVREQRVGLTFLTLCPRLRVLELDHMPMDLIAFHTLPLLEVFSARSVITTEDLLTIQRACPGLKRLQLHGVQPTDSWEDGAAFSQLDAIACLSSGSTLFDVIPPASTPRLGTVVLKCDSSAVFEAFGNFLRPAPFRSIRALAITGSYSHRVVLWFSLLPYLVELSMINLPESGMVALFPAWARQRSLLHAPRLDRLRLVDCAFGALVVQSFLSFVAFRDDVVTGPPLRQLVILEGGWGFSRANAVHSWLLPRLKQLLEDVVVGVSELDGPVPQYSWV